MGQSTSLIGTGGLDTSGEGDNQLRLPTRCTSWAPTATSWVIPPDMETLFLSSKVLRTSLVSL